MNQDKTTTDEGAEAITAAGHAFDAVLRRLLDDGTPIPVILHGMAASLGSAIAKTCGDPHAALRDLMGFVEDVIADESATNSSHGRESLQ